MPRGAVCRRAELRDALSAPLGMASLGGFEPDEAFNFAAGKQTIEMIIELPKLANGACNVDFDLEVPYGNFLDRVEEALAFEVVRPTSSAHGRTLQPHWGVGSIELPCRLLAK